MKTAFLNLTLLAMGTCSAWAGTVCPAGTGATPFTHSPDAGATGCNVVITINADRSTTVSIKDSTPYEASEDVLIGVVNSSSSSVPAITLTGSGIFGLEGDGMCTFTFVGSGYCTTQQKAGTDPEDYYGPDTTYSITNANTGTVNFTTPIAPSGSTYFSLEGVPSVSLTVTVAPPSSSSTSPVGTPALSVWAMLALAGMLMGFSLWAIRARRQRQE